MIVLHWVRPILVRIFFAVMSFIFPLSQFFAVVVAVAVDAAAVAIVDLIIVTVAVQVVPRSQTREIPGELCVSLSLTILPHIPLPCSKRKFALLYLWLRVCRPPHTRQTFEGAWVPAQGISQS